MSAFGTYVLIVGLAVLLIVGLLRLIRDLLSGSVFAAPSSPDEEHVVEIAEDARPANIADSRPLYGGRSAGINQSYES
jgi:hypothetical protein